MDSRVRLYLERAENEFRLAKMLFTISGNEKLKIDFEKEIEANDIDVLLITSQNRFERLKREIGELNKINEKDIHAVYQTSEDLKGNISKRDKVVLNALKGIVAFGGEKLIEALK